MKKKSDELIELKQSRFEYIQFLNKRFNEEIEREKNIQSLYDKIERMQIDHHKRIGGSLKH